MADGKKVQAQNQINIELSEEIAEGIYSNLAMIAHSNSGKFSSVFAMTHAMFELAHVGDKYNPVLPKWIIQQRLKIVIPSEDFAKLQDAYTKAVVEKGDVESAKSALYAWLKENEAKLTFDKGKYLPKN